MVLVDGIDQFFEFFLERRAIVVVLYGKKGGFEISDILDSRVSSA
jgi:hypothetical protein